MPNIEVLRKARLFQGLSDSELATLSACLVTRSFGRGVFIFHKDSPGHTLYIVESGNVRIFALSEMGQEITLDVYGPGDVLGELGFLDGLPRSAGAITMTPATLLALRREDLQGKLEAHPRLAANIVDLLTTRLRRTTAFAESLAFLDVNGRVALRLLELADRFRAPSSEGQGEAVELKLTQAELASWVVSTRETVNKILCAYRDQHLIDLADQRIIVLDRRGLRRLTGR
jgi:CRP-like cAMP-binding protein